MGLPLGSAACAGTSLEIWPEFPSTLHEFWLYAANAAVQRGVQLPDFMRPVSGLEGVRERIAAWGRAREIQRWKRTLDRLGHAAAGPVAAPPRASMTCGWSSNRRRPASRCNVRGPRTSNRSSTGSSTAYGANMSRASWSWPRGRSCFGSFSLRRALWPGHDGSLLRALHLVSRAILGRILRAPVLESRR